MNCENRWNTFLGQRSEWKKSGRLFRLNPDLGEKPPKLDDFESLPRLKLQTSNWLRTEAVRNQISEIACSLVASSFYFEASDKVKKTNTNGRLPVKGVIRCRIGDKKSLRSFGRFLESCRREDGLVPQFVVQQDRMQDRILAIPDISLSHLTHDSQFHNPEIEIELPEMQLTTTMVLDLPGVVANRRFFNLSGFPRDLRSEDFRHIFEESREDEEENLARSIEDLMVEDFA